MTRVRRVQAAVCLSVALAGPASAQTSLADLTLEELMSIEVTSASRHEERAEDVPAAVYVISRDDIRRSGMTTVPELLRLAPGVHVARINSNKWAVSVRGFNNLYSNKLLVMVDGRSIYNPAFSAVLWETEDLVIEDIDRVEVIRGPGGAMWGANAVNGVINIITRPTDQTIGGLARISGGTFETGSAAVRYGGRFGAATYRVFAQGTAQGESLASAGGPAGDRWQNLTTGFRTDWSEGRDAVMLQGSVTSGRQRPLWFDLASATPQTGQLISTTASSTGTANVVARWTRSMAGNGTFQAQGYFDTAHRDEAIGAYTRRTWDIDAQYHTEIGARHDVVAGGGYRHIVESMAGRGGYAFNPGHARPLIVNGFAQDAISLAGRRVEITLGAKFEHNTLSGSGFQPNARAMWKFAPEQRLWAGAARAVRIPSLIERGLRVVHSSAALSASAGHRLTSALAQSSSPGLPPLPVVVGILGNPDFTSEHLLNVETGYRLNIRSLASIDVVGFAGRYDHLTTFEPLAPAFQVVDGVPQIALLSRYDNRLDADARGAEIAGRVQLREGWQLDGAFSAFHLTPDPKGSRDPLAGDYRGNAPSQQWRAHLGLPALSRGQADLHVFRTGAIEQLEVTPFTRVDARLQWSLTSRLAAVASGQNLLHPSHPEFPGHSTNLLSTRVPRSGSIRLLWQF